MLRYLVTPKQTRSFTPDFAPNSLVKDILFDEEEHTFRFFGFLFDADHKPIKGIVADVDNIDVAYEIDLENFNCDFAKEPTPLLWKRVLQFEESICGERKRIIARAVLTPLSKAAYDPADNSPSDNQTNDPSCR